MIHCDAVITYLFSKDLSEVLMIERVKNQYGFDWGFICGKVENGETAEECVKREIKEELGLTNITLYKIKKIAKKEDNETFYHHYYCGILDKNTKISFQKSEIKSIQWFSPKKLPKSIPADNPVEGIEKLHRLQ